MDKEKPSGNKGSVTETFRWQDHQELIDKAVAGDEAARHQLAELCGGQV